MLEEVDRLLGRPQDDHPTEPPGVLGAALREAGDALAAEWNQRLAELPVHLIEEPGFRLAGAEEAVRYLIATLEQVLQHHEPLAREVGAKAADAYGRLQGGARGGRRLDAAAVVELLRGYGKWRYQSLLLGRVAAAFVGLRGNLSDTLREINSCRDSLTALLRRFEAPPEGGPPVEAGRRLFAEGCRDLDQALERLLARVKPEALLELDAQAEAMLKERFQALVHVCLSGSTILRDVEVALLEVAANYAAGLLPPRDVAGLFLEQHVDADDAAAQIADCVNEAAPELTPGGRRASGAVQCVLTVPPGPDGDRFAELAREALTEAEVSVVRAGEDIVFYRELSGLPLTDLEQFGSVGQDAYRQMSAAEGFTPHSRVDVDFTPPRGPGG
jgi:hypothetical protein